MRELHLYRDIHSMSGACARLIASNIVTYQKKSERVSIILAGGNTPRETYNILAGLLSRNDCPEWVDWFTGDERWVPPSHTESNERAVRQSLLEPLNIPRSHIHSWEAAKGEVNKTAARYDKLLEDYFNRQNRRPHILLLGMGADGHTASLFPGGKYLLKSGEYCEVSPEMPRNAAAVSGAVPSVAA